MAPHTRRSAGIIAEAEVNLTLTHIGVYNVQGDGMSLQLPQDFGLGNQLNTNVVVSDSTFNGGGGGSHGLVVEAVGPTPSCPNCGAKFINNTWSQLADRDDGLRG